MVKLTVMDVAGAEVASFPLYDPPGAYRWGELRELIDHKCQAREWRLVGVDNLSGDNPVAWVRTYGPPVLPNHVWATA